MEKIREIFIKLDNEYMIMDVDQGDMSEVEFEEMIVDYVLSNIQIEII